MPEVVTPAFFFAIGVTAYAAALHFGLGLTRPRSRAHLTLAAMSAFWIVGVAYQVQALHATTAAEFVTATRWNLDSVVVFGALLPWFVFHYSHGTRPAWPAALSAYMAVLVIANHALPNTLQFEQLDGIYRLRLPWGEAVSRAMGQSGPWTLAGAAAFVAIFGYSLATVGGLYWRTRRTTSLWVLAALGVLMATSAQGILVRLNIVNFVELGPFGYCAMILIMGAAVGRDTKQKLRATEASYQALFAHSPQAIIAVDPQTGDITEVNETALEILQYTRPQIVTRNLRDITRPEDLEGSRQRLAELATGTRERLRYDRWYVRRDGSSVLVDCQVSTLRDEQGKVVRVIASASDITERRQMEEALRESERRLRAVIGQSPIAMAFARDGVTIEVNEVYLQTFGYDSVDELRGRPILDQVAPQARHQVAELIRRRKLGDDVDANYETMGQRKDGSAFPIFISAKRLEFRDGPVTIAFLIDITRQKESENEIRRLAFYDHLTDLANRQLLNDRIRQALASCARTGRHCALLLIDLDNFKSVNDTLGHAAGDDLLRVVAQRLSTLVRQGDSVARLGGDEFVVLLEDLGTQQAEAAALAEALGEKILSHLGAPVRLGHHDTRCTCSVGVTVFRDHHLAPEDMIRQADIAMYEAKNSGRNLLRFFDPRMQELINARVSLERDLHAAIDARQFVLHYQIQVDSAFLPVGAEALIRWMHPERGLVAPGRFIPLAEETGLIVPIGQWVLDAACEQLERWRRNPLTRDLVLAINVSSKQFRGPVFVDDVRDALRRYRVNPAQLKLELTESMLIEDFEEIVATMNALKALGVRFSLDDFGTGYSSLQYLKRLPLDQLKIDQSFVRDIAIDPNDHAIVRTVIAVARSLNLDVIAEGVETDEQRNLLVQAGCTHFQGYFFGKPASAETLESFIEANLIGLRASEPAPAPVRLPR